MNYLNCLFLRPLRSPSVCTKERSAMRIAIIVMLAVMALMMMALYAMLVVASRADERAERMYRKWKEEHGERER